MNPRPVDLLHPPAAPAGVYRFDAGAVIDAAGIQVAPGSLLLEVRAVHEVGPGSAGAVAEAAADLIGRVPLWGGLTVLAVGRPGEIDARPAAAGARVIRWPDAVLLPPFVNAHAHLDLTHIGPQAHDETGGFIGFVDLVRARRAQTGEAITASVRRGIELSLRAGVVAVGDIAGAPGGEPRLEPWQAMADSPITGVSFVEFFGIGKGEARGFERLDAVLAQAERLAGAGPHSGLRLGGVQFGLQPHAPNTIARRLYAHVAREARERGWPICTHLAETIEEHRFVGEGAGPQRELLERLGVWTDAILEDVGRGATPVEHLAEILGQAPWMAVHLNDVSDADIEILARARACAAYCPRASAYFGAERHFGPHRYRDLLRAGVTVALGTDSVINLPAGVDADGGERGGGGVEDGPGLSILDEMRFLHGRDGVDPHLLLAMGTVNGARVLGLDESCFTFRPGGALAGLVAVDVGPAARAGAGSALEALMRGTARPRLVLIGVAAP